MHIDLAGPYFGRMYLLVTDVYSKWPEIVEMRNTTANKTVEELRKLGASYGLPQ